MGQGVGVESCLGDSTVRTCCSEHYSFKPAQYHTISCTNRAKAQSDRKQFWHDASKRGADGAEEGGGDDEGGDDAPNAEGEQGQVEAKDDATDNSDEIVEAETKAVTALVSEHPRFGVS